MRPPHDVLTHRRIQPGVVRFLYDRYVGKNPGRIEANDREVLNAAIARQIFDLRSESGLSQRELAERVGTSASAVCRLEDVEIRFVSPSADRTESRPDARRKKKKA